MNPKIPIEAIAYIIPIVPKTGFSLNVLITWLTNRVKSSESMAVKYVHH